MTAVIVDRLKFVQTLQSVGFTEKQAKVMSELQRESFDQVFTHNIATKEDILAQKVELKAEIVAQKIEFKQDINRLEKEIIKLDGKFTLLYWMFAFLAMTNLSILLKLFG